MQHRVCTCSLYISNGIHSRGNVWFRGEAIVCERFLNSSDGSSEVDPPDYLGGVTVFEIGLSLAR